MFGGSAEHLQKTEPNTTEHFMLKWPRFGNILSIFLKKNSKKIKILSLAKRQKIIRTKETTRCCLFWVQNIEAWSRLQNISSNSLMKWSVRFGSVVRPFLFGFGSVRPNIKNSCSVVHYFESSLTTQAIIGPKATTPKVRNSSTKFWMFAVERLSPVIVCRDFKSPIP